MSPSQIWQGYCTKKPTRFHAHERAKSTKVWKHVIRNSERLRLFYALFLYRANLTQLGMWFDCRLQVETVPEAPYYQLPAFPHYQRWGMREMTNLGYQEGKVCFVGGVPEGPGVYGEAELCAVCDCDFIWLLDVHNVGSCGGGLVRAGLERLRH